MDTRMSYGVHVHTIHHICLVKVEITPLADNLLRPRKIWPVLTASSIIVPGLT